MAIRMNMSFPELSKQRQRALRAARSGSRRQAEKAILEVYDYLLNVDEDLNYHQAILDGSWPNAIPILERALALARAKQQEKLNHANLQIDPVSR